MLKAALKVTVPGMVVERIVPMAAGLKPILDDDLALLDAQHDIASVPTPERVELMERVGIFGRGSFRLENGVPKAFVNTTRHRQLLHSGLRFAWHEVREATARIAVLEGEITELRHRLEAGRN